MKDYIYFFILFTLLEITFTALYFLLVDGFDLRMVIGALIYACGMISAYLSYREERYQKQRKALIDALP
jgi:hypothetical protein